jgi:SAM-dependent methyltransferase
VAEYDKHYEEEHHFGEPYPDLVRFFRERKHRGKVLDLGCGQGRDVLAIARLGFDVTGVDISPVGIEQMLFDAKKENLPVKGVVADIYEYPIDSSFDFVLLDSMLHYYKRERKRETRLLQRIMNEMKSGALLRIFVSKSKTTEPILEGILEEESHRWVIVEDTYIRYPEMNSLYRMIIAEKKII